MTVPRALTLALVAIAMMAASTAETRRAAPAGDGTYTDVKIEGNVVTIVVPLAVVYALSASDGPPDADGVAFIENGFAAAAAFWNAGFARLRGCFELRVSIDVAFTTLDAEDTPERGRYHTVNPFNQNMAGTFPDGRGFPTVVYPGVRAGDLAGDADTTYPFDEAATGYLPEWLFEDRWALAHELGHFFGLGDDYRDGEIIPGREGTLMGGAEGGDYIDQALVNDVTKLIEDAGYELPSCITGKFSVDYENHFVTEFQDQDTTYELIVTFALMPKEDGILEGEGEAVFHTYTHDVSKGENGCESFLGPVEDKWPVTLEGRFTDGVLSFEVTPTSKTVTFVVSGSCGSDSFPHEVAHFPGWADIRFTDGGYQFTQDTPHLAPNVGNTHVELKLKQEPAD